MLLLLNFVSLLLQTGLHEQYGGVKPDVARDAHAAAITSTVASCMEEAGVTPADLTAVAVTIGPGLSLCLQVRLGGGGLAGGVKGGGAAGGGVFVGVGGCWDEEDGQKGKLWHVIGNRGVNWR